jgi:hypothetical protein
LVAIPVGAKADFFCDYFNPPVSDIDDLGNWEPLLRDSGLKVRFDQEINEGKLHMGIFAFSDRESGNTGIRFPSNRMICTNCENISAIWGEVCVNKFGVADCRTNVTEPNFSRIRIIAPFFSICPSGIDCDDPANRRDVIASIRAFKRVGEWGENNFRIPPHELEVLAKVEVCDDALCEALTTEEWHTFDYMKSGECRTLSVEWDQTTDEFYFKSDDKGHAFQFLAPAWDNRYPPVNPHITSLRVDGGILNCQPQRSHFFMDVSFDYVCLETWAPF